MPKNKKNNWRIVITIILVAIVIGIAAIVVVTQTSDNNGDEDENEGNTPPEAVAMAEATVRVGDTLVLDGSNSSDEDGDELEYFWDLNADMDADEDGVLDNDRQEEGRIVQLFITDTMETGLRTFTLMVDDGEFTSTDTVVVTITAEEVPEVYFDVTYGDPPGLFADPHYILTVDEVSEKELIEDFSYQIVDPEDNEIIAGELSDLLNLQQNETVRYIDLATDPEGIDSVSTGDQILIRDTAAIEEESIFYLYYKGILDEAGSAVLMKNIVP